MYSKVRTTIIRAISIKKEYLIYVSILFSVRSTIGDKVVLQHVVAVGEQRFNRRMSRVQRPVRIEKKCKNVIYNICNRYLPENSYRSYPVQVFFADRVRCTRILVVLSDEDLRRDFLQI